MQAFTIVLDYEKNRIGFASKINPWIKGVSIGGFTPLEDSNQNNELNEDGDFNDNGLDQPKTQFGAANKLSQPTSGSQVSNSATSEVELWEEEEVEYQDSEYQDSDWEAE